LLKQVRKDRRDFLGKPKERLLKDTDKAKFKLGGVFSYRARPGEDGSFADTESGFIFTRRLKFNGGKKEKKR